MTKGKLSSTRADHCAIVESHNSGVPIEELCEKFNLKRATITRIIKNYEQSGLSLVIKSKYTSKRSKLTKDQLSKVLCYYNSSSKSHGDVVKFIFCMFGVTVSRASVGHYLQRARTCFVGQTSMTENCDQDFDSAASSSQLTGGTIADDEAAIAVRHITLTPDPSEPSDPADSPGSSSGNGEIPVTNFMETSMRITDGNEDEELSFYSVY